MKTNGMAHQVDALRIMNGREHFALLMEMGTGKTWTVLADAERMHAAGRIEGLLVVAPKGVHTNWVRREIPTHLSCSYVAAAYASGVNTKRKRAEIDAVFAQRDHGTPPPLRILTFNIESLTTKDGYALAERFLNAVPCMMVVDESVRIKNPNALRTKKVLALGRRARMRRICSGLPVTNAPMDIFSQFEFLESGLLGTTSYRSFVAEYAELLPEGHGLMRHIQERARKYPGAVTPQVVAKDAAGRPIWRNLDKLREMISKHSFRVLKSQCLDLPQKIYTTRLFELEAAQRRIYTQMEEELRLELGPQPEPVAALAALGKLRQITSGFVMLRGEPQLLPLSENPRMNTLLDILPEIDGQFIIWAHYRAELAQIAQALGELGITCVQYHGGISDKDREAAVDDFQSGAARVFLGQEQSGGIGLTLTAASTVIYYSHDFNLDTRLQSEDRAHRIGTKRPVLYIDIVAQGTKDEGIVAALQGKGEMAADVLGDNLVASALFSGDN